MSDAHIPQLFAAVIAWATAQGAQNIRELPGVWRGETADWLVKINGHPQEVDGTPAFSVLGQHKTAFVGFFIVDVISGIFVGPTEDDLIAHFEGECL